jgi:serine/threonine protein kinase
VTDIIHGDIKPHNILVFDYQDEEGNFFEGEYYAKVADFGFSAWSRAGNDLVFFPESRPWNAPEYHHRGFSIDQAKRMDIYSFGLVCLWLLFGAKRDLDMAPPVDLLGACERPLNFDIHGHQQTTLEAWKKSDNGILMRWIRWLIEEHVDSDPKLKDRLIQIFQLTLAFDPEDRTNNYRLLRELLSPTL